MMNQWGCCFDQKCSGECGVFTKKETVMGYHKKKITKGVFGEISKIEEELEELKDAREQNAIIMMACELADLYGAIREFAARHGMNMRDLEIMADLTESAFKDGSRS